MSAKPTSPAPKGRYSSIAVSVVAYLLGALQLGEFFEQRLPPILGDNILYWPCWLALYTACWFGLLLLDKRQP